MIEVLGQYITSDVEDIITELRDVLASNNIQRFNKIVRTPNNIQVTCPFHKNGQERKPSFGISTNDGVCHCFTCGWSGTLPEMVSNVLGYNDGGIYGSKWLIKNFLTVEVSNRKDFELDFSRIRCEKPVQYVPETELEKYRVYHPYMWERKMTPDVVDIFDVGYDKDTECLTFPIRDEHGNCLFVARRSVKTKFFHYPNNVAKPVYGVYEYKRDIAEKHKIGKWGSQILTSGMYVVFDTQPVIICESMINAITCWVYGKYAVALNGTGTKQQIEQLKRMPNRKFILALDPDEAGEHGRERLRRGLTNKIVTEYIIPEGKDINDLTEDEFNSLKEIFN